MAAQIPTALLKMAREDAGLSQGQLASLLDVSSSVVSRLESTEHTDAKMAEKYLFAIKTDLSKEIIQYFEKHWKFIERPSFNHPEKYLLWNAEQALQLLNKFEKGPQFDPILQDPVSKIWDRIISESEFIRHREHGIAFIGDIGVGKTTALSFASNLVLEKSGKRQSVFPSGSGRTTVCEIAIKIAPAFGIAVESLTEDEVRQLVSDLVVGLKTGKGGLPSELDRVIRNMAGLTRITTRSKKLGEKPDQIDPLKEIIDSAEDCDQVISDVISRMKLDTRTEAQMILSESTEGSLDWLADNISKINYGQHSGFSIPQRITILLPLKALRETPYLLSLIDTKGVEGTTQRPDLKAQIDDSRTVIVLCTKFNEAPGGTPLSIMHEVIDSGSDALEAERLCLLVLPRNDEAVKIIDDSGNNPDSFEEGYAIRESQIHQQFSTEQLPSIPINFFNIEQDRPEDIWSWLTAMIERVRLNKANRINRLIGAANDLVTNSDIAKTRQARLTVAQTMEDAANRFRLLPPTVRPAHQNLIAQAKKTHQSSIAASANRRGNWQNFSVPHILGVGVRNDINLRTRDTFIRIDEQIEGLKKKYAHLLDIKQFLEVLQDDLAEWKQDFLGKSALIGRLVFLPHLKTAEQLWRDCDAQYGAGNGYRLAIADIFQKHFEEDENATAARSKVESALTKAWNELIINKIIAATSFSMEEA